MSTKLLLAITALLAITVAQAAQAAQAEDKKDPAVLAGTITRPGTETSVDAAQATANLTKTLSHRNPLHAGGQGSGQTGADPGSVGVAGQNAMGGSNIGGSDRTSSWCISAQGKLTDASTTADMAIIAGDWVGARDALVKGLGDALGDQEGQSNPVDGEQSLTYRILNRGLDLAGAVSDATEGDPLTVRDQVNALKKYYRFAQSTSKDLDLPLFIAINKSRSLPADAASFENSYEIYAKSQLNWLLDNFTNLVIRPESKEVHARIPDKAYLKMAEFVARDVESDLRDPIFGGRYDCVANSLEVVRARLNRHNLGDPSAYNKSDKLAINVSYPQLHNAAESILGGCHE
jgi:hypothetical protein